MADFLIAVFFVITLNLYGFDFAMKGTMTLAALIIGYDYTRGKHPETMQWVGYGTIFLFGIPSLIWKNPLIFQHKITIVYTFFSTALLCYPFFTSKTLIEVLCPGVFLRRSYPSVNRWLALVFFAGAVMNALAVKYLSLKTWGIFKIVLIVLMMLKTSLVFYYFLMQKSNYDCEKLQQQHDTEPLSE